MKYHFMPHSIKQVFLLACILLLNACSDSLWNNPYPASDAEKSIYYDSFSERPKHLDPVSSYSSNEYTFLGQIYEPPLQYHFLKRPYELIPLTASEIPMPRYFDKDGIQLDENAAAEQVAEVHYRISIQPGILFQPHPAFALDKNDQYAFMI